MSDIRLRLYSNSVVRGRVLKALSLTVTDAESATSQVSFAVSQRVAGYLDSPFLVGVERLNPKTGKWFAGRNDLFIALEDEEDTSDASETVSFTGMGFVPWLLMWALHWWNWDSKDHKSRDWDGTPGKVLGVLLSEAQDMGDGSGRSGWGPHVTWDFTNTADSYGRAWVADDRITMNLPLWKSYSSLIDTWVDQGYFEWWTEGAQFRMARSGTGDDRTNVTLGGVGFTRSPAKASFNNVFTRLVVVPDGVVAFGKQNPGADTRWGELETAMSQSGVDQRSVAERNAMPILADGRAKKREMSYEWTAVDGLPTPYVDFTIGDTVSAMRRDGKQPQRVIGVVTRKEGDSAPTFRTIVGSKLIGLQARLAKKVSQGSTGTIIGGSGSVVPPNTGVDGLKPAAPAGLHVVSNVGSWAADGSAVATVKLGWDAVTLSEDATPIDVDEYEVWARDPSALASVVTRTRSLEATVKSWRPPGVQLVSVRVRSVGGKWSELSPEVSVTPAMPASIVPKAPTNLAAAQAAFYTPGGSPKSRVVLSWDAVTQSTDDTPVDVVRYEVWERTGPGVSVFLTQSASTSATFDIPSDGDRWYRVRAVSDLGFAGDLSAELKVSPSVPLVDTTPPSTPVLVSGAMTVEARWDGLMSTGDAPGSHIANVLVQWSVNGAAPWRSVGGPLDRAGSVTIPGSKGVPVHVRFVTMDSLGRTGGTSAVVSAAPVGVGVPDIDAAINDAIDQATEDANNALLAASTADGRVTVSPDAPVAADGTGKSLGSVWFQRSAGGMFIGVWEWTSLGWVSRQLDNATIANLDAAKINTGFLDAARIAAKSITADKVLIAATNMLIGDPRHGAEGIGGMNGVTATNVNDSDLGWVYTVSGGTGTDQSQTDMMWFRSGVTSRNGRPDNFDVTPGSSLRFRAGVGVGGVLPPGFTKSVRAGAWFYDAAGAYLSWGLFGEATATAYGADVPYIDGILQIPVGAVSAQIRLQKNFWSNGQVFIVNPRLTEAVDSNLIVDGAVTARTLNAEEIWGNQAWLDKAVIGVLETPYIKTPEFAQNLAIESHGTITMLVGRADQAASDIADVANAANNAQSSANVAAAVADGAVSQALEAFNAAAALQGDLTNMQAVYSFTSTEAIITTPGGERGLHMAPDGISMKQDGLVITRWEGQQMIVQTIVVDSAKIGNHVIESFGGGRTVIRPL